ncbi:hypothetical protein F5X99DRAFT_211344 [Biscogniauxia marginata]|nr:hypothetical protein F5X99DRAFT_211344 [Biscogniauxia marginata]
MYSRSETVNAVLRFYREIIRHPYLNNSTLIIPPPNGWNSINIQGGNETVLDLLRHLSYLRPESPSEQLLVHWETIPVCYADNPNTQEIHPLPAHCVYLTHSVDREELLDSWTRRYAKLVWMSVPNPIGVPMTGRFYSRAESRTEEELVQQRQLMSCEGKGEEACSGCLQHVSPPRMAGLLQQGEM